MEYPLLMFYHYRDCNTFLQYSLVATHLINQCSLVGLCSTHPSFDVTFKYKQTVGIYFYELIAALRQDWTQTFIEFHQVTFLIVEILRNSNQSDFLLQD